MKKKVLLYLTVIIFTAFYACDNQEKERKAEEAKKEEVQKPTKKVGVGMIALKPEYLESREAFFEFYPEEGLKGEKVIYNPFAKENSKDIKPKYFDVEKQMSQMICLGWRPGEYKVLVNDETGKAMHLPEDTSKYIHLAWRNYLPKLPKVWRLEQESNPIRLGPKRKFDIVAWDTLRGEEDDFIPLETKEQWIKIQKSGTELEGWILWVEQSEFSIGFVPVPISEFYEEVKGVQANGRFPKQ